MMLVTVDGKLKMHAVVGGRQCGKADVESGRNIVAGCVFGMVEFQTPKSRRSGVRLMKKFGRILIVRFGTRCPEKTR